MSLLRPEDASKALAIYDRLKKPGVRLRIDERQFLSELIQRAVDEAVPRKKSRRKNSGRDYWVAMDLHLRQGRHRAKEVAKAWSGSGLTAEQIQTIASRGRAQFEEEVRATGIGAADSHFLQIYQAALKAYREHFVKNCSVSHPVKEMT